MPDATTRRSDVRTTIVEAAAELLREHGPAAVTTRGVAEAAGVQAPTIYRLFGDKGGLLDAVAEHVMATYVSAKAAIVDAAAVDGVDPLADLHAGWTSQIEFGLANPTLFRLLSDPDRVWDSAAARSGRAVLAARVHRIAATGRLRVGEDRAVDLIQAAGIGAIQALLSTAPEVRDPGLADALYDAVLAHVLTDERPAATTGVMPSTVAFRTVAPDLAMLSDAERALLLDWLDRAIDALQETRA